MSKFFEEFIRIKIDELEEFKKDLKGELTIVISEKKNIKNISKELDESDKILINNMINKISTKEIINIISTKSKIPKKLIYNYCLKLKNEN